MNFLFDNLAELQAYDAVKVYYDNGQHSIAESLHLAIEYALSKDAVVYRSGNPPSTGFRRRRTTSAPWNSQQSSTRSMRPPRRTRSSSESGQTSRRAFLRRRARSSSNETPASSIRYGISLARIAAINFTHSRSRLGLCHRPSSLTAAGQRTAVHLWVYGARMADETPHRPQAGAGEQPV